MPVAARFYVIEHTRTASGPWHAAKIVLAAVSRGDQNRQWASATPVGRVELTINNPEAADWFLARLESGDDVSLMFDTAPVKQPADGHPFRVRSALLRGLRAPRGRARELTSDSPGGGGAARYRRPAPVPQVTEGGASLRGATCATDLSGDNFAPGGVCP
jgi:hypothetical protein